MSWKSHGDRHKTMRRSKLGPAQSRSSKGSSAGEPAPSLRSGQALSEANGTPALPTERSAASLLRQIPSVDELLGRAALAGLEARVGRRALVEATRRVLDGLRSGISSGAVSDVSIEALEREVIAAAEAAVELSLRPVVNATGVILHTNLGRAPLAREAVAHLTRVATHDSNL